MQNYLVNPGEKINLTMFNPKDTAGRYGDRHDYEDALNKASTTWRSGISFQTTKNGIVIWS
jgi:hypothetical protein